MATYTGAPPDPLPPDENVGPILLGVSGPLIVFVVTTTSLRIWVRCALRALSWDDYTIVISALLGIARFAIQVVQVRVGNGRHIWYISKENYVKNTMLGLIAIMLLCASICFLKISIILLLLRLKTSRRMEYSMWAVMAGLVVTNFGCIIIILAECDTFEAYWTGVGKCWDVRVRVYAIYFTIAYSIATDILCSLLPGYVIWRVRLPLKTKISLWALMSLGLVTTGFGIARASSLSIVTADLSWLYAITAIWSNLELYLGITGANLALSRSTYAHFFGDRKANNPSSDPESGSNSTDANRLRNEIYPWPARPPSPTRSDNSEIPLEPTIQKRTDIWVTEERMSGDNNTMPVCREQADATGPIDQE